MPFTAIATALVGGLGAAAVQLVATGLSIGAQYLYQKHATKNRSRSFTAFQSETQFGGQITRNSAFGLFATKGHEVGYFKFGSGNSKNVSVFQLADFTCGGLEDYIFLSGEKTDLISKPIIGNESAHYGISGFENLTSIRFYDGRPGQMVDQKLVNDTANLGRKWAATSRGTRICYVVFEYTYNSRWDSVPDVLWVLRGLLCYDPRKDSTVNGGSGLHRIDDVQTWEYSTNPAIHRLNFLLGFKAPITGRPIIGMGKSLSQIHLNDHIAAANICDAIRTVDGRDVVTYQNNVQVLSTDDFSEVLSVIDDSMAGYGANKGGLASIIPGAPKIPTFDITADDVRRDEGRSFRPLRNNDDLFNTLSGQYTSIENSFQPLSLQTVSVNQDIADDRGIRQVQQDFLQVTDKDVGQYLLFIRYRQNRLGASVSLGVRNKKYLAINAGDWGTYDGKLWMCVEKRDGRLELGEVSSQIYSSDGILPGPAVSIPATPVNPSLLSTLQNFAASAGVLRGASGESRPVIRTTWTPPEDPTITGIVISYTALNTDEELVTHTVEVPDPEAGSYDIDQNLVSGFLYSLTALIKTNPDRFRQATFPIETSVPTPLTSMVIAQFGDDIREALQVLRADFNNLAQSVAEGLQSQSIMDADGYLERDVLQFKTANALAAVVEERLARVEGDEALAEAVTSVIAQFEDGLAGGQFRITAEAGPAGIESRISLSASAGSGGDFAVSGLFIDVVNQGNAENPDYVSRVAFDAEKFTIGDDGQQIFSIIDGDIVVNAVMRSADNKFKINPLIGQILIED